MTVALMPANMMVPSERPTSLGTPSVEMSPSPTLVSEDTDSMAGLETEGAVGLGPWLDKRSEVSVFSPTRSSQRCVCVCVCVCVRACVRACVCVCACVRAFLINSFNAYGSAKNIITEVCISNNPHKSVKK